MIFPTDNARRSALCVKRVACSLCILLCAFAVFGASSHSGSSDRSAWDLLPRLLEKVFPPSFPRENFNVTDYGAIGDGKTDCTRAFKNAIDACNAAGGGRVVVPSGIFCSGAIHLKSNVNLCLSDSAIIRFETDPAKYLPVVFTRWEGVECMNYSPFIYAYGQENIAITGGGTLDGNSDSLHWWPWKGKKADGWREGAPDQNAARKLLMDMGQKGVPVHQRVFGDGFFLRPNFIQPYKCRKVFIEGVRIIRSPMWEIHPVLCDNVIIENVDIVSHGPNNDGCDPESCRDVLIRNCSFDTGDDCIAIKSGRNNDGRRINVPCENVIIQRCRFKDGHGGITIGSEESGGVRNVYAEDCEMDSPNLDTALRIKANAVRGGVVEDFFVRRIKVGRVGRAAVEINLLYEEGENGGHFPQVRNIRVDSMSVEHCPRALSLIGFKNAVIKNITFRDSEFKNALESNEIRYVEGLKFVNCEINGKELQ
jgi:polygalacturonase